MPEWLLGLLLIGGSLVGGVLLILLGLYFSAGSAEEYRAIEGEILSGGELIRCWIVFANNALYRRSRTEVYNWCQVVFTFEDPPDPDDRLETIAGRLSESSARLRRGDADDASAEGSPEDERRLASVLKTWIPYTPRLRVTDRLAGGLRAYTASVPVLREHLPDRRLTLPYTYGMALPDEERGKKS